MYWVNVQGLRVKAFVVCCLLLCFRLRVRETIETTMGVNIKDSNSQLFVCVFVCLLVGLFVCLFVFVVVCFCVCLFECVFVCLCVSYFVCLCVVCLFVCLSGWLFVWD